MKKTLWSIALASGFATPAFANELSADLNPDAFHIQVDATHASNGIIYAGELLLTNDNGEMVAVSMKTDGQIGNNPMLRGGIGGKIYAIDDKIDSYGALSLGGRLEFTIPTFTDLSISTELYAAPSVTMTGDADSFLDFTVQAEYKMFENAALYGGARHIKSKHDNGSEQKLDNGLHAGIRIEF